MAPRSERLDEFFRRLTVAPSARSFDEAFGQMSRVLNEVEDELSGIPYDIKAPDLMVGCTRPRGITFADMRIAHRFAFCCHVDIYR
jgi:hypothetical protein